MAMALTRKRWTIEELHSLPDDGNKYELVRGELFVTPPPSQWHETVAARLSRVLTPFVEARGLGLVYHPRSVLQFAGSEVEPDLMVRRPPANPAEPWDAAPIPSLVVEVLSPTTRRRDHEQKRALYVDAGVPEYWLVDPERREVHVVHSGAPDRIVRDALSWTPARAGPTLVIEIAGLFE